MAKLDVYNKLGEVVGQIELSDAVFAIEPNESVLHQVVKQQLANKRQGTSSTRTRTEVRGGGRKPWRQKGTGRARQGSIRAAQWVGGGIIFGPKPRDYSFTVPKKQRRLALKSAFSSKLTASNIKVVEDLQLPEIKTKSFLAVLKALKLDQTSSLIVEAGDNKNLQYSARNLPQVATTRVNTLNVYDVLSKDVLVLTKEAALKIQEVYA
ncbi:50S ribosomal protein L4 [Amygdalobacter indicium]|uniref:50S ribosomal protein L4 n=1 Tax=Amygdalobacter indicium TaxID=3029272 RepID=UPI0027AB0CCC|nr:50S ribosomal protein L4 [Amygdalobacter indicium]WEG34260.1 50S ribosomal protein L4 [Amygdalobacter indicium]